eukprot:IDg6497t1
MLPLPNSKQFKRNRKGIQQAIYIDKCRSTAKTGVFGIELQLNESFATSKVPETWASLMGLKASLNPSDIVTRTGGAVSKLISLRKDTSSLLQGKQYSGDPRSKQSSLLQLAELNMYLCALLPRKLFGFSVYSMKFLETLRRRQSPP